MAQAAAKLDVRLKRAYYPPSPEDGVRVLVDRLWPRGVRKADAAIDRWAKEVAPSTELRRWFGHNPSRWEEFRRRYRAEMSLHEDAALFFADPACAAACARSAATDAGHGRIEERSCRVAEASWLAERHPGWKGLRSLAAVTAKRTDKKNRRRKYRDPLLHHFPRTRPQRHPRRRTGALGHREQSALDDGCDFRRRPLPNPKRRLPSELRHHPPRRVQYAQSR